MARHHMVVVETIGYFTFSCSMDEDPIQVLADIDEYKCIIDDYDVRLYYYGDPEIVQDSVVDNVRKVTIKATASINKGINTSDEEYKVWRLIDWDNELTHYDRNIKILLDYDQKFEVIDDDSWWIDDEELEDR